MFDLKVLNPEIELLNKVLDMDQGRAN